MVNLNICNSNRINFGIHDDNVTGNQKAGVALATGCIGKLQKKLGRTVTVTFDNQTFEVNKKSFDKWVARNSPKLAASTEATTREKIITIVSEKNLVNPFVSNIFSAAIAEAKAELQIRSDYDSFEANILNEIDEETAAATKIQAAYRGYKSRKANQKFTIASAFIKSIDIAANKIKKVGNWFLTHPFRFTK